MLHQAASTRNVTCLSNEVGTSFTGATWRAADLPKSKRPNSYQGMIAAGKQNHGSRTRPQTA